MSKIAGYRAEIDGLRAIAVIPVVFFHADIGGFSGGFVGVDVFFVISGYLITKIIIHDLEVGRFNLLNFYERRARRILPALFFIILVCIPFAWLSLMPQDMKDFAQSVAATSVFSSNILFYIETGYFATAAELKPLLHTWSLSIEEQYYVLYPLLMLLIWRMGNIWALAFFIVVFLFSLGYAHWAAYNSPEAAFFLLPARAWELILGSSIAYCLWERKEYISLNYAAELLSIVGLSLIIFAVFIFDEHTPFPSLFALVPTLGTSLLIIFAVEGTVVNRLLSHRYLVGIGLISYSAYLWHHPIFAFTKYVSVTEPGLLIMGFLCLLSFLLAYISWRYIERPFRDRMKVGRKYIFSGSIISAGLLITFGILTHKMDGFDSRLERNDSIAHGDIYHDEFHNFLVEQYFRCTPESIAEKALKWEGFIRCVQSKKSDKIDIALVGDSHVEHLFIGVAESLPQKNVVYYIKNAPPLIDEAEFKQIFSYVLSNEGIETVVISMHYIGRIEHGLDVLELQRRFRRTVESLFGAGKNIVVVDDVPRFYFHPVRCLYELNKVISNKCEMSKYEFIEQRKMYAVMTDFVKRLKFLEYIDISDLFCDTVLCSMTNGDVLLFRDNHHLNILGSSLAGSALVKRSSHLSVVSRVESGGVPTTLGTLNGVRR